MKNKHTPQMETAAESSRSALDEIVLDGLRHLTKGLLILCAAFVVFDWLKARDQAAIPILIGDVTLMATFLAIRVALGRGSIPARVANPLGALIALLLEAPILLELSLRSDPVQTGYVLMIATGAGFFVLSFRWLISLLGVLYVAWALAIWPILSPESFIHLSVALFSASAMTLIIRTTRVRSLRSLHNAISAAKAEAGERKDAEKALSESEEKYRNLFRQSSSGKALIDRHGTIQEANQSALDLLGCTRSELVGASLLSIHPSAEAAKARRAIREVTEHGSARFELEMLKKDGANFTAEVSANLVETGDRRMIEVVFRDVSERKQSEAIQAALLQISQAIGSSCSLHELMAVVHRALSRLVDTTNLFLALYDAESDSYSFPYHVDEFDEPASCEPQRLGKSLTDYVRRTGKPLLADAATHSRLASAGEVEMVGTPSSSWLGVPLKTAKGVIGVVALQSYSRISLYSDRDLDLMTFVSENIALAIERQQREEALRLTQFAVDSAADAVFWIGPDGRFLYVNDAACTSLGYSRDELLSMTVVDIAPFRSKEEFPKYWEKLRKVGCRTYETVHKRKNGELFPVELSVNYQEHTGSEYLCALARDVTERKRAEESLRESEVRFRSVVQSAQDAIIIADSGGTIVGLNAAATAAFGYSQEEAAGQPLILLIPERHRRAHRKALAQAALSARDEVPKRRVEMSGLRRDGTEFPVEISITSWQQEGQRSFVHTIRDITERKRAEKELDDKNGQLLRAQKMEAVGQLAGGVAHDFNNLLTGISGYAQLTLSKLDSGSLEAADLREVLKISNRAAGLTRQLLAFSRQQPLEPKILNLNTLVDNMSKMLNRLIGENIDVEFVASPDVGNVKADPGQVEQVLMNLVVNARDAMPEGGQLTIETSNVTLADDYCATHQGASAGPHVMLAVTDTGCGMDEDTRRQIFEPFFTTKGKTEGTGLGLATVYGIVKQHGGNIWVYSEVGRGTTFKVYLPRADEKIDEADTGDELETEGRGSGTILLVEDERAVREVARRLLEAHGYRILMAATPSEAECLFAEHSADIDLLLTDVVLPEMDGPTLHEKLSRQGLPLNVLYMSGYTGTAVSRSRVLASGAPFLQKPFTRGQLTQKVEEVLSQ